MSRVQNDQLYPLVATGDEDAIREMIENNIPFVKFKVGKFIKSCPQFANLRDDLESEGYLVLVDAIRLMARSEPKQNANATAYVSSAIQRAILRTANIESKHKTEELLAEPIDHRGTDDLLEEVLDRCESDLEEKVVTLRADGFRDVEIAERLGISESTVNRARRAVESRFDLAV